MAPGAPARTVTLNVAGREEKYQLQQPMLNIQQMETKIQIDQTQTLILPLGKVPTAIKSSAMSEIPFVGQLVRYETAAPEECRIYAIITPKIYAR